MEGESAARAAVLGAMLLVFVLFFIATYVYFALALKTIAEKTNTENTWWEFPSRRRF